MWKIVAPVALFAVLSFCSGNSCPGIVYLEDFTLKDEGCNDVCSCNGDGTLSCKASPGQKLDFVSTWVVQGVDCSNLWVSLIWRDINKNASTRSYACPVPSYDNNLVIHGDCDTQEVCVGKHVLEPFRFTVPNTKGPLVLEVLQDSDFTNGAKTRDCYLGTMYLYCD